MKFLPPNFKVQSVLSIGFGRMLPLFVFLILSQNLQAQLSVSLLASPPPCGGINSGSIIAMPSNGIPPYQFIWNTGATTQTITNLGPGTYSVTVTDSGTETAFASVLLNSPPELGAVLTLNSCTFPGTITANPNGGTPPYGYNWSTGATTQTISYMNPGQYCVTVTDDHSCGVGVCIVVPNAPPTVQVTTTDVLCAGDMDGTATATAMNGTPPYSYLWNTGATTQTIVNLGPGTYCVTVTDDSGCTASDCGTVSQPPPLTVTAMGQNPFCNGDTNGTAAASANGGTPPISYLWSTGQTSPVITGLAEGTYSVTATDANDCEAVATVTLIDQSNITVQASATDVVCFGDMDGTATAMASLGVAPYSYLWNTGANTQTITGLAAGSYSVTASDQLGCTAVTTVQVGGPGPFNVMVSGANVSSCGAADGSATATPVGGVPPFTYSWNNGGNTQTITGLIGGVYIVTITDATGCTANGSIFIGEPTTLALTINATDEQCDNANDGSATAVPMGGNAPYSYIWSTGQMTQTISNLAPGLYSVTVMDAGGCIGDASVVIMPALSFSVSVSDTDVDCFGDATGTAIATPAGGVAPYVYLWSNGQSTQSISGLTAGAYMLTVTDANGCEAFGVAVIEQPDQLLLEITIVNNLCAPGNASAVAVVEGGTMPYAYLWNTGATTPVISGLFPGVYSLTVTDANGCTVSQTVEVVPPDQIILDIQETDITCNGAMDGSLTVLASGGQAPYSYIWNTGATSPTISNLGPGVYAVTVTDANGCQATDNELLLQPAVLTLSINGNNATCPNGNDGTATASASGGTSPYSYMWSNGQSGPNVINLSPGVYTVTATDAHDCVAIGSVTIESESNLSLTIQVQQQPCPTGAGGSLEGVVTGGANPITYLWSTGDNTPIITGLAAGNYGLTVSDALGCVASQTVDLISLQGPVCQAIVTQPVSTAGASDGAVAVIPSGGTAPYTYLWSNGIMTADNAGLPEGIYSVTVTDANGCETTCTVQLGVVPTAKVGNKVWEDLDEDGIQDSGEPGYPNVSVNLTGTDENGNPVDLNTTTDAAGMYLFNPIPPGLYKITFGLPPNYTFTLPNVGNDSFDSDANPNTGMTDFFILANGDCDTTRDAGVYLFCENVTYPGQISGDETLCGPGNDPGPIVEVLPPSGGTGPLEYLWMFNIDSGPFDPNVWNPIPNSNSPNYDPGPITATTYYIRCVRREGCVQFLESNIVVKVVDDVAVAIVNGPESTCLNEATTYSAPDNGPGATYSWNFGTGAVPATSTQQMVDVTWTTIGFKTITLVVTNDGCTSYASLDIIVTNSPAFCDIPFQMSAQVNPQAIVQLEWSMDWLDAPHQFTAQRAVVGTEFINISELDYQQGQVDYSYLDLNAPDGWVRYRVMLEDEIGNQVYSNIVEVLVKRKAKPWRPRAYPNPTDGNIVFELGDAGAEASTIQVRSLTGKVLKTISIDPGNSEITISIGDLPDAVYLFEWQRADGSVETIRVIKI
ncbi:MAG: T9SS type A sorting domain-containing protein [Saprospiraceae bacterium]|nr:T9SS type A sorting domain-containing protein [Saprospiraceae bacterium]